MIMQCFERINHETINVLHNRMTPGDGALTKQFLDRSLVTSASCTTLGLKQAVALFLDSLLHREAITAVNR